MVKFDFRQYKQLLPYPITKGLTLELGDPDFVQDFTKIKKVKVRRSMSGRIRTYIVHDRKFASAITYTLRFVNLHRQEAKEAKAFLTATDGHYLYFSGIHADINAIVEETKAEGSTIVKVINKTEPIMTGDTLITAHGNYLITGAGLHIRPSLSGILYAGQPVAIAKQQMIIITNQEIALTSEERSAGLIENPELTGPALISVEDERYTLTLSILALKTR